MIVFSSVETPKTPAFPVTQEPTEYQTASGQSASQKLSLEATTPPAEVPGHRLHKFLGSGAFGQVWVGTDLNTGRSVAVKFYLHRGGVNWSLLSREVKSLVQLSADRHVVQVLEVGWDADPPYYVMELVSGGSLEDLLSKGQPMPISEAVEMFRKILVGLNHCHGKGVLHCDLKPANILLGEDLEPRLADFGQSRMSHDQTPALGTLFYMAPEQADLDSTPDASWDVYAAGAILYRMITGTLPYRDSLIVEKLETSGSLTKRLKNYREAIQSSEPPDAQAKVRAVDRGLSRIINRCLAPKPSERYANVQQIIGDLNRRDRARERRPLMLLGIVGPLLILLATCVFAVRSIRSASRSTVAALRSEAFDSNQLTAKFAARTLETEIGLYFDAAQSEAKNRELHAVLQETFRDKALARDQEIIGSDSIQSADGAKKQKEAARESLLDNDARVELDTWLSSRLQRYRDPMSRRPLFATLFVTDKKGTIIGIAYDKPVERAENSVGRNFAYRTYFHGGHNDLDPSTPIDSIDPLRETHLSGAFLSTATGLWKVAVSTPIYFGTDRTKPDGVFVATINLGDFQLLQSEQDENKVAVLIEARQGPTRGTLLQHPLMDENEEFAKNHIGEKFQLDDALIQKLLDGGNVSYRDPVATTQEGKPYAGEWIVAMQPVELPTNLEEENVYESSNRRLNQNRNTDLLVLVQYRLSKILAPVDEMESILFLEGAAAIGTIIFVTILLWLFAQRISDTKSPKLKTLNLDTTSRSGETETIAV